jgi:hypothetical protein
VHTVQFPTDAPRAAAHSRPSCDWHLLLLSLGRDGHPPASTPSWAKIAASLVALRSSGRLVSARHASKNPAKEGHVTCHVSSTFTLTVVNPNPATIMQHHMRHMAGTTQ